MVIRKTPGPPSGGFYQVFKEPKPTSSDKSTLRIKKAVFSNSFYEGNTHFRPELKENHRLNSLVAISVKAVSTRSHLIQEYLSRRGMLDR